MIDDLPMFINALFLVTTLLTVGLFYKATGFSRWTLAIIAVWVAAQSVIGLTGFYEVNGSFSPRLMLLGLVPFILVVGLFSTDKGKAYIDSLDLKYLTYLHVIRVPIEIILYWLFLAGQVPQLMTFEGRNFDILAGMTAPFVAYFGFHKNLLEIKFIVIWNYFSLALLANIVVHAVLSIPTPIQQFAFEQPNVAVLHFPFLLLPACIIPIVLLSHLVAIRRLLSD